MTDTNTIQESPSTRAPKSARFPSIALDYALEVTREARKLGKNISDVHIAGKSSTKSGAFMRKKASLGYYGLIAGRGTQLVVTDLAEEIIYAKNDQERAESLKKSFLSPDIFKNLADSVEKNVPLSLETLGNVVIREYGIQPSARDEFLNTFTKSGIFAGLIAYDQEDKKNIILLSKEQPASDHVEESSGHDNTSITPPVKNDFEHPLQALQGLPELQRVEISLTNGTGWIIVPKEFTEKDANKLKKQIEILADVFE